MRLLERWVVDRSATRAGHFRRMADDGERLRITLYGLDFPGSAILMPFVGSGTQ